MAYQLTKDDAALNNGCSKLGSACSGGSSFCGLHQLSCTSKEAGKIYKKIPQIWIKQLITAVI